jgi:tRNA (adenine22-N1)-methyltransferase
MNRLPKLTPRLATIAQSVPQGAIVADVGTDHGYIPVYLTAAGICPKAYASDIKEGPIASAKKNIAAYGMEEKVTALVAPGLEGLEQSDADTIVIAGMGGEMIRDIIKASDLAKKEGVTLILQPMTSQEDLKRYLFSHGFQVREERICQEGEKFYTILWVVRGEEAHPQEVYHYIGYHVLQHHDEATLGYLRHQKKRYEAIRSAMEGKSGQDQEKLRRVKEILQILAERLEGET